MKMMCIGDKLKIQCYKHNKKIHREWSEAVVLDIKKDYIVFGNNKTPDFLASLPNAASVKASLSA